jgi:protein disulfide-isomerase
MKTSIIASALLGLLLTAAPAVANDAWQTNFKKALAESKQSGKPILVDFTGSDWCTWCRLLDIRVFRKQAFRDWAKKNVILVELDFPSSEPQSAALRKQNDALAKRYGIKSYPTVLILDSDGKVHGKTGYKKTPEEFIKSIEKAVKKASRKKAPAPPRDVTSPRTTSRGLTGALGGVAAPPPPPDDD